MCFRPICIIYFNIAKAAVTSAQKRNEMEWQKPDRRRTGSKA